MSAFDRDTRVPARLISLRFPSLCCICSQPVLPKAKAFYDDESKAVTCQPCLDGGPADRAENDAAIDAPDLDAGVAGAGPQREYERRNAKRNERIEQKWGWLAPVAKFLSDEPQHTAAFGKGAGGERRLASHLEREVGDGAIFLHSRKIPNGDIDHLAIAPSGIYVIDAKNYTGRIEARNVGNWRTVDRRLYVGGRDKSKLLEGTGKQVSAVTTALGSTQLADSPIHPVLCFTDSEWGIFAKPLSSGPVSCLWAEKLCELIKQPGPLDPSQRYSIAALPCQPQADCWQGRPRGCCIPAPAAVVITRWVVVPVGGRLLEWRSSLFQFPWTTPSAREGRKARVWPVVREYHRC